MEQGFQLPCTHVQRCARSMLSERRDFWLRPVEALTSEAPGIMIVGMH